MIPEEEKDRLTPEARVIIEDESKKIEEVDIAWVKKGNAYRTEVSISHNMKITAVLDVLITVNATDETLFSFVFRRNKKKRVMRYCPDNSKKHKNRLYNKNIFDGEKHKHIWTNLGESEKIRGDESHYAYSPQDGICGREYENAFFTFLEECNITYPEDLSLPPLPREAIISDIFLYP